MARLPQLVRFSSLIFLILVFIINPDLAIVTYVSAQAHSPIQAPAPTPRTPPTPPASSPVPEAPQPPQPPPALHPPSNIPSPSSSPPPPLPVAVPPAAPPPPGTTSGGGGGGLSGGQKAGIAIGVLAGAGLLVLGGKVCKKRQRNIRRSRFGNAARRPAL